MPWPLLPTAFILLLGVLTLILCSDTAVEFSTKIARRLGVPPLMTGLVLVSLGTDFPEIVNALISSAAGHANIGLGDALGSFLAQFTLVLGLLPLLGRPFPVSRREIVVIGVCAILGLLFAISIAEKGHFTRINALVLVATWPAFLLLTQGALGNVLHDSAHPVPRAPGRVGVHLLIVAASFIGVAIGSYAVVQSVLRLASALHVSEYLISFFAVAIGTSLPELVVDLTAIRKGRFELALGDIIGSCLVDATVAVGIGQVFFPQVVNGHLALTTGLYAAVAAIIAVIMIAARRRLDRRVGVVLILLYLGSYALLGF